MGVGGWRKAPGSQDSSGSGSQGPQCSLDAQSAQGQPPFRPHGIWMQRPVGPRPCDTLGTLRSSWGHSWGPNG